MLPIFGPQAHRIGAPYRRAEIAAQSLRSSAVRPLQQIFGFASRMTPPRAQGPIAAQVAVGRAKSLTIIAPLVLATWYRARRNCEPLATARENSQSANRRFCYTLAFQLAGD